MFKNPNGLPNNGNTAADYMHENDLFREGMTVDEAYLIVEPLLMRPEWAFNDDFWDDFLYRAEEIGHKISC